MPEIFRQLQELDEKRIRCIRNFMAHSAEVERKVFPIINQCLDGIVEAANEINEKDVSFSPLIRHLSNYNHTLLIRFTLLFVVQRENELDLRISRTNSTSE